MKMCAMHLKICLFGSNSDATGAVNGSMCSAYVLLNLHVKMSVYALEICLFGSGSDATGHHGSILINGQISK